MIESSIIYTLAYVWIYGSLPKDWEKRHQKSCEAKSQFSQYQNFKEGLYRVQCNLVVRLSKLHSDCEIEVS